VASAALAPAPAAGIVAPDYIVIAGSTGAVVNSLRRKPGDTRVSVSEDGDTLLIEGSKPRVVSRGGQLRLDFTAVTPPWPSKLDWSDCRLLLSRDGTYVLVLPRQGGQTIYHVEVGGNRAWELRFGQDLAWEELVPPVMSQTRTFSVLIWRTIRRWGRMSVSDTPEAATGVPVPDAIHTKGSAITILETYSEGLVNVPGDHVGIFWSEELGVLDGANQQLPQPMGVSAICEWSKGVVLVLAQSDQLVIRQFDYDGRVQRSGTIRMPFEAQWKASIAGEPPIVMVAGADQQMQTHVRVLSMDGVPIQELDLPGAVVRAIQLSSDGRRAIVAAGEHLNFLRVE
jgi:hypothetical protein